jgi:hypothetical protein
MGKKWKNMCAPKYSRLQFLNLTTKLNLSMMNQDVALLKAELAEQSGALKQE